MLATKEKKKENSNKCTYVDTGIDMQTIHRIVESGDSLRVHSLKKRREVRQMHGLGWTSHLSKPCESCGHRICRCSDRSRRQAIEECLRESEGNGSEDDGY